MKKTSIEIQINDNLIKGEGKKENNILILNTKDELIKYNLENNILIKESKDLKIKLNFIDKTIDYELVNEKMNFHNIFEVFSLTNYNKQVIIKYRIEHEDFSLVINYETI